MRLQKTITVFIDEEPEKAEVGDLLFKKWKDGSLIRRREGAEDAYEVYRNTSSIEVFWVKVHGFILKSDIVKVYGIDIPALDRAHLIGG